MKAIKHDHLGELIAALQALQNNNTIDVEAKPAKTKPKKSFIRTTCKGVAYGFTLATCGLMTYGVYSYANSRNARIENAKESGYYQYSTKEIEANNELIAKKMRENEIAMQRNIAVEHAKGASEANYAQWLNEQNRKVSYMITQTKQNIDNMKCKSGFVDSCNLSQQQQFINTQTPTIALPKVSAKMPNNPFNHASKAEVPRYIKPSTSKDLSGENIKISRTSKPAKKDEIGLIAAAKNNN